jgi:hypothetical protein
LTEQRKRFELLILDELRKMNEKLDEMIKIEEGILRGLHENRKPTEESLKSEGALDVMTLLTLPGNLRKTAMVMCKLTEATAQDVARETGRKRAVESALLNELASMGYLAKKRQGRRMYFVLKEGARG